MDIDAIVKAAEANVAHRREHGGQLPGLAAVTSPTEGKTMLDTIGDVGRAFAGVPSAIAEAPRIVAGEAIRSLNPFGSLMGDVEERDAAGQSGSTAENTVTGIGKGVSFGLMGTIDAALDSTADRVAGYDTPSFSEQRQANNEMINDEANIGGEIIGALMGGPAALAKGASAAANAVPALGKLLFARGASGMAARAVQAGSIGAAEGALYTLAEGNNLDAAQSAALTGALFGGGAQPAMELIAPVGKYLMRNVLGRDADITMSAELRDAFTELYGDEFTAAAFGGKNTPVLFDENAISEAMQRADDNLALIAPEVLRGTLREMSTTSDKKLAYASNAILRHMENMRNLARPEFQTAALNALQSAEVRSRGAVANEASALRQSIQPEYDAVLEPAIASGVTVPAGALRSLVQASFADAVGGVSEATRNRIMDMVPNTKLPGGNRPTYNARQLLELRQSLDSIMYSRRTVATPRYSGGESIDGVVLTRYLGPMREALNDVLYMVAPDLKALDAQYSNSKRLEHAYEAGRAALARSTEDSSAVYDSFVLGSTKSAADLGYFVEGVKAQLLENIGDGTSTRISNYLDRAEVRNGLKLVEDVVGPEAVAELRNQLSRYVAVNDLTKGLNSDLPSLLRNTNDGNPMSVASDAAITAGAIGGKLSAALGAGAARRQLAAAGRGAGGRLAEAQTLADLLQQPADTAAKLMNQSLAQDFPGLSPLLPGLVPTYPDDE